MKRIWKYLWFFLLCLAIALLINLPIRQVLPHINLPATVSLSGAAGTVVHGTVQEISVNRFPFRAVNYDLEASCLFLLKLCYRIEYDRGTARVAYDLLNRDTEVAHARTEYLATELAAYVPNQLVQPEGSLELHLEELVLITGKPARVIGKVIWRDFGFKSGDASLSVGDLQIDFNGNPQQYDFKFNDLNASLDINGKGNITANGQYRVDIGIVSEATIDSKLKNVLELFAKTISYNNYRLEQSGRLPANVVSQLFN